jgi:hypothetical protein
VSPAAAGAVGESPDHPQSLTCDAGRKQIQPTATFDNLVKLAAAKRAAAPVGGNCYVPTVTEPKLLGCLEGHAAVAVQIRTN